MFGGYLKQSGTHFTHDGQRVFLSGANTAWVSFGYDFGDHQYQYRRARYIELMEKVRQAGGNSMRTWVHIEGQTSPKFDHSGHVTGLDSGDGSFLADFRQYLDDARARDILIFPTLWNGALKQHPGNLAGLITDTSKLQSYLDHALVPWVQAVKGHPALGGWDVINEMEGVLRTDQPHNHDPCQDTSFLVGSGAGWAGASYTAQQLQRFINWQVDAIRRSDPTAQVTAGSWSQKSQTDQWGNKNLYSDHCLVKAGGKAQGTLTFYSTHTYDWHHHYNSDSPFKHHANDFQLDKPLVIAEFNQLRGAGQTIEQLFNYAYYYGYAGAWSWHANADGSDTDSTDVQMRGIAFIKNKNDQAKGGRVSIDI
ncbi:mannan endo-1,4-beta-mannosidase-like [Babylonia areolata]|uniref:mannan endo-1,4-beta-mannosidase-like n=1 Tax=Babylonia areolata TaxID=304850 RepID=UPI003FD0665E